ncbi:MAG: hypothetical protein IPL49_22135 [Saprospirales bacterium]|nr:hypothetical protein [Saprospirales bacterium]
MKSNYLKFISALLGTALLFLTHSACKKDPCALIIHDLIGESSFGGVFTVVAGMPLTIPVKVIALGETCDNNKQEMVPPTQAKISIFYKYPIPY